MTMLYVATEQGLLMVSGDSAAWRVKTTLEGKPTQCLAADPLRPELVYCGTFGQGLWRSLDGGRSWKLAGRGISHPELMAVAVSRSERIGDHGVVWAGTEPSRVYRSTDRGETWLEMTAILDLPSKSTWSFPPRPYTHHVRWITTDDNVAGLVFVCIERGGVMRSMDAGLTWQDRVPGAPLDVHTLRTQPSASGRLYAAAGDGYLQPGNGYAESDDSGATWHFFGAGLGQHYLWSIAVDPGDPDTIVVSAAASPNQAHNAMEADSYVYRQTGDGPWQPAMMGLPESHGTIIPVHASNEAEPGVFYTACNKGIFRSPDGGRSWERIEIPWPENFYRQRVLSMIAVPGT